MQINSQLNALQKEIGKRKKVRIYFTYIPNSTLI